MAGGSLFMATAPAFADTCPPYGPSDCTTTTTVATTTPTTVHSPNSGSNSGSTVPKAVAASASSSSSEGLAFTGADVAVTSTVGAGAVAMGGLLVLASRRRRSQADQNS
jgi:hypothetical protein